MCGYLGVKVEAGGLSGRCLSSPGEKGQGDVQGQMEGWLRDQVSSFLVQCSPQKPDVPWAPGLSTGSQAMECLSGPSPEPYACFLSPLLMDATSSCLRAQLGLQSHCMVPWFDQKTPGVFHVLEHKVMGTPWVVGCSQSPPAAGQGLKVWSPGQTFYKS